MSIGQRRVGVFRAPGLAAAFTKVHWGTPEQPPLAVIPSDCPAGCTLTIVGHGFIDATARIQVLTDVGMETLATVPTHDGDFTWKGTPPTGLPPGNALFNSSVCPGLWLTLLTPGTAGFTVTAGPAPSVAPAQAAHLRYPPLAESDAAPGQHTTPSAQGQDLYAANGGQVLRTADGGRTWAVLHDFQNASVIAVSFGDALEGWVAVQHTPGRPVPLCQTEGSSCLMRTTDGGASWTPVSGGPPSPAWVNFFSARSGVVVTHSGAVYRTADGGTTWTPWGVVPWGQRPMGPLQVDFGSPDFGVAGLMVGAHMAPELATTADGGRSWTTLPVAAQEIISVSSPAANVIWMVARTCHGTNCAATIERTTDGSRTWSAVSLGEPFSTDLPNWPFQVVGQSATAAWLVVPGHQTLYTHDGGQTWTLPLG